MPCYSGEPDERIVYRNGIDPNTHRSEIQKLQKAINWLEAGLCAIITELEKKGIANEVISQASKSGLIDLMDFWQQHKQDDVTRLAKEIHKFSEHEQEVIRKLLNKEI